MAVVVQRLVDAEMAGVMFTRNPMTGGTHEGRAPASESSMAGARSDQKLAAIITPAANPSDRSSSRRLTCDVKKTVAAPSAVTPQVKSDATRACHTAGQAANDSSTRAN